MSWQGNDGHVTTRLAAPVVLPCAPAGGQEFPVLRDGIVDIDADGRILRCCPRSEAPEPPATAEQHAHPGILLPGMINAHAHTPMVLFRGAGGDLPLQRWLHEVIWPREAGLRADDVASGMLLGGLEMLRGGITTSVEMYFHSEQIAEAVLTLGSRVIITPGVLELPGFGSWQSQLRALCSWIDADGLRWGPGERIELGFGPHSTYAVRPEVVAEVAGQAMEYGALLHTHAAETYEEDEQLRGTGRSVPQFLAEAGVLGHRLLLAHGVHLDRTDLDLLARSGGTGLAHCPGSNAKLACGVAPLLDAQAAGLPVGLGTDGPASNDDLDLWQEMQLAGMLARLQAGDAAAITARDLLLAATRHGALAIGRSDLGSLTPGSWADVIAVDTSGPAFGAGLDVPDAQLLANLVWASGSQAVQHAWVAGERVLTDGHCPRIDEQEVAAEVRRSSARLATR